MSATHTHTCPACNTNQDEGDGICNQCGARLVPLRSSSQKLDGTEELKKYNESQLLLLNRIPLSSKPDPRSIPPSKGISKPVAEEPIGFIAKFINKIKDPFNAISLGFTIISVVFAVYFYFVPQQAADPAYLISEERSQIFDSTNRSPNQSPNRSPNRSPNITVLDKDGKPIEDDIYLATVTFWNAGNESIRTKDIVKPVRLHLSPTIQLLDYSIIEQRDEDADFELKLVSEPSENSKDALIELSWYYLGPDAAIKIQIIYVGDKDAEISFKGRIDGTTGFSKGVEFHKFELNFKFIQKIIILFKNNTATFNIISFLLCIYALYIFYLKYLSEISDKKITEKPMLLFIAILIFIILNQYGLIGLSPPI